MVLARHIRGHQRQRRDRLLGIQHFIFLHVFIEQGPQAATLVEGLQ